MNVLELRKQLHSQIDKLDDKALEVMHNMVQIYFGSEKDFTLTKAHKDLIDERLEDYEKNPHNVISWEVSDRMLKKNL